MNEGKTAETGERNPVRVSSLTLAEQNHLIIEYGFDKAVKAEAWFNESHSADYCASVYALPYIKSNEYLWS